MVLLLALAVTFQSKGQAGKDAVPSNDIDLLDLAAKAMKKTNARADSSNNNPGKVHISAVPAAGYTLQTGFAGLVTANAVFAAAPDANASTVLTSFTYTVRNQIILPLQINIFTKGNKYNFVTDWRYLKFPSYTYGLGGYTSLNDGYLIDYSALRLHQTIMRRISPDIYAGVGYNLDYFWGIRELNPPAGTATDFQSYGLQSTEFASGLTFNFLYDSRTNPINSQGGMFVNLVYRPNLVVFGNTATWRSLVADVRKYIYLPGTHSVFALWTYEWLTVSGKPPYLMLPNTGGDPYSNTGRGYIQGRFRGANMAYVEGEYRFPITRNELIGGVVFANAESFTEQASGKFEVVWPGWGAGIRLKLNKFSRTNIALDYGFGLGGSNGLFVNLGEVF